MQTSTPTSIPLIAPPQRLAAATTFLTQCYHDLRLSADLSERLRAVEQAIDQTGTYEHLPEELAYGAKVAWRNSNRCIGRLYWSSLEVQDYRSLRCTTDLITALTNHLHTAFNGGKIRNTISVFAPLDADGSLPIPRLINEQLIRYAAYQQADGTIIGDPAQLTFTQKCQTLGWQGTGGPFDPLPLVFEENDGSQRHFNLPESAIQQIRIEHPHYEWFQTLNLQWYALPAISNMVLEIGGILYPFAPFNGWYMVTEVGSRNLGDRDRYNCLPKVAAKMGLSYADPFWKDRALTELNVAVLYSFRKAGTTMVDHHTAAEQYIRFERSENRRGREVTGDWTWLTPPTAGSTTKVFHRSYSNEVKSPNFYYPSQMKSERSVSNCPFHIDHRLDQLSGAAPHHRATPGSGCPIVHTPVDTHKPLS